MNTFGEKIGKSIGNIVDAGSDLLEKVVDKMIDLGQDMTEYTKERIDNLSLDDLKKQVEVATKAGVAASSASLDYARKRLHEMTADKDDSKQ